MTEHRESHIQNIGSEVGPELHKDLEPCSCVAMFEERGDNKLKQNQLQLDFSDDTHSTEVKSIAMKSSTHVHTQIPPPPPLHRCYMYSKD